MKKSQKIKKLWYLIVLVTIIFVAIIILLIKDSNSKKETILLNQIEATKDLIIADKFNIKDVDFDHYLTISSKFVKKNDIHIKYKDENYIKSDIMKSYVKNIFGNVDYVPQSFVGYYNNNVTEYMYIESINSYRFTNKDIAVEKNYSSFMFKNKLNKENNKYNLYTNIVYVKNDLNIDCELNNNKCSNIPIYIYDTNTFDKLITTIKLKEFNYKNLEYAIGKYKKNLSLYKYTFIIDHEETAWESFEKVE